MTSGGPNHTHPSPDRVLTCPGCNVAGGLYKRQDGTIRCLKCGHECDPVDVNEREPQRGRNLTTELRRKGGEASRSNGAGGNG